MIRRLTVVVAALAMGACAHAGRQVADAPLRAVPSPRIAITAPVALASPQWAEVSAVARDTPEGWCPSAVAWTFSDGTGNHAFPVGCADREWSELHHFESSCDVRVQVFSGGRLAGEVMLPVTVGGR